MVCVCNATYCDEFPPLVNLNPNEAAVYVSSITPTTITIKIDDSTRYQTMLGFGGAFTEKVAFSFLNVNLSSALQSTLLGAYFGEEGIGYTIGRVPMEGGDIDGYEDTDDNVPNDFDLNHFNLTDVDFLLKIPVIKGVQQLVGDKLKLFATPWSAPAWMKASGKFGGGDINSQLKGDMNGPYYRTWANYFIKYFEAYAEQGIHFWGMTVQNEPVSGIMVEWKGMFMNAEMHRKFVRPNSVRIELTFDRGNSRNDLDGVAFITPEYQHVVVLQNRNMTATYQVSIQDAGLTGKELRLDIEPRSLVTLVWN
uniref:Glucosylceramidase n=1 Tax=Acrobeloides nanus TaxID=290746 RepID=A0A914E461_9BILA